MITMTSVHPLMLCLSQPTSPHCPWYDLHDQSEWLLRGMKSWGGAIRNMFGKKPEAAPKQHRPARQHGSADAGAATAATGAGTAAAAASSSSPASKRSASSSTNAKSPSNGNPFADDVAAEQKGAGKPVVSERRQRLQEQIARGQEIEVWADITVWMACWPCAVLDPLTDAHTCIIYAAYRHAVHRVQDQHLDQLSSMVGRLKTKVLHSSRLAHILHGEFSCCPGLAVSAELLLPCVVTYVCVCVCVCVCVLP